jgi:hypothetical protein
MGTVPAARENASATVSKSLVIRTSRSASDLEGGPIDFNPLRAKAIEARVIRIGLRDRMRQ